ncbi:hypothetical protein ACJMK2_031952 [Sinanodonta woodiana]|uniref:Uncharacterized protein n=1 Tax=Sinanodonta woodiana TaxID=1069815 RepID=A0ABD3X0C8_SINWO
MAAHTTTDKVLDKLKKIQCLFTLEIKGLTQRLAKDLLNKLQREFECQEYDYPEEQRRYYNLMTYLHYFCRQLEAARSCNREALKMDPECIVSLANQAWISYLESSHDEDCQEIEKSIRKAVTQSLNRIKLIEAKAEIAYSYARFGTNNYEQAELWYQMVVSEVEDEDNLPSFLWQYGYGLIKRRNLSLPGKVKKYTSEVKQAADLLYKVAKQDKSLRFKARAWVELGTLSSKAKKQCKNWQKLFPNEISDLNEYDIFSIAFENIQKVNDIPALEQYAHFLNRRKKYEECKEILQKSIAVKDSSRAYQLLALVKMTMFLQNTDPKQDPPSCINFCDEVREILSDYDSAFKLQINYSAMACKTKFLYAIEHFKDAIDVCKKIYSSLEITDTQPEELDRNIRVFFQIYHAKCLLRASEDASEIMQAKDLLRSAIEMSFDLQRKRLTEIQRKRSQIMSDQESDDHNYTLPRMIELQMDAIKEMKCILQNGEQTTESMLEEIALCELIKDDDRAIELCIELSKTGVSNEMQIDVAKRLITYKHFDKGLFLLKTVIHTDKLDYQTKNFTITAQVDGAMDALIKQDFVLTGTRLRDAFNVRFCDQETTDSDMLHVFLVAHECNIEQTLKLKQLFDKLTKLNIASCFDATPASSLLDMEDSLQKSYVIAVIMDTNDLKNDEKKTRLFKKYIKHIKNIQSKALVAIKLSEQFDVPSNLSDVPHIQLGNEFQQDNTIFMHDFFKKALLNST